MLETFYVQLFIFSFSLDFPLHSGENANMLVSNRFGRVIENDCHLSIGSVNLSYVHRTVSFEFSINYPTMPHVTSTKNDLFDYNERKANILSTYIYTHSFFV